MVNRRMAASGPWKSPADALLLLDADELTGVVGAGAGAVGPFAGSGVDGTGDEGAPRRMRSSCCGPTGLAAGCARITSKGTTTSDWPVVVGDAAPRSAGFAVTKSAGFAVLGRVVTGAGVAPPVGSAGVRGLGVGCVMVSPGTGTIGAVRCGGVRPGCTGFPG